ncbi:MAG: pentapeptide repeat-containing protein [Rhizomicrobium sp.]
MKRFTAISVLFMAISALAPARADPGLKADPRAVARLESGIVDCPGCQLAGANLLNLCVKARDLHGANFDGANATLMCMSFANFRGASFRGTILDAANLASAKLDGADMTGARTRITSFLGTDLTRVKGLTQSQLDTACGDAKTKVPAGMKVHFCS